jgi:DNA primase
MIPEELIQQVREAHDIVDVVSAYVTLRKRGKSHIGLCPFHSEKTPSFSVVQEKQFFHCFGCHAGGDVIKFIMDIEGFTYIEAVKHLAEKAGILLPEVEDKSNNEELAKLERMKEAHLLTAKLYHHVLIHTKYGENAREYLKQRGLSKETIQKFVIGYAPNDRHFLTEFLSRRGFDLDEMVEAGLIQKDEQNRYYDRFIHRIQFPIEDKQGKVVAFSGRTLGEGKPKYLNSPETPIFQKSSLLFNLFRAKKQIRKNDHLILLEGHLDAIQLCQAGIENVVASQGTAFTDEMARLIRRYASSVTICYDSDEAGLTSAGRAADLLIDAGIDVRVAMLPDGFDPDDYVRKFGGESFRVKILKEAMPITAFRLERLRNGKDLSDSIEQRRYVEEALEHVSLLSSAIERDHYISMLSKEFHIPAEVLRQEVNKIKHRQRQRERARDRAANKWNTNIDRGSQPAEKNLRPAYFKAERKLLSLMLKDKELIYRVMEEIGGAFNEPEHTEIAAEIYACVHEDVPSIATAVLHRLSDPKMQSLLTSLIMDEMDEPITDTFIQGLIQSILDYPKQKELEEMIVARQNALEMEDFEQSRMLDKKIKELKKQLKTYRYKIN